MPNFFQQISVSVLVFLLITSRGYAYEDYYDSSPCIPDEACFVCQPEALCGVGFMSFDLLYWIAFESGLDICVPEQVTDTITPDGKVISRFRGKGREPHFRWDPGFRVGFGYAFPNRWDIAASWTHFHSHGHFSRYNDNESSWNLYFDVIDIIGAYRFDLTNCLTLRPFAGLRAARIDQKISGHNFSNFSSSSSSIINEVTLNNSSKQKFSGIGPLVGLELDWDIGCCFSLYANTSISWLYGNNRIRNSEYEETLDFLYSCRVNKNLHANLAGADVGFGIRWQKCICNNTKLLFQLGLEHHRYFDYNRIGGCGDLNLDGVNFSVGIEF